MITSASNKNIKNVQVLLSKAKERKKQGVFVVEGPKMSFEAPYDWVSAIYMSESFFNDDRFKEEKQRFLDKTEIVSDSVFKSMSDTQTPQGVLAIVRMPHYEIDDLFNGDKTELLVLESIQDPGNLGTMIRTGEGAGVSGIIMNRTTVDIFNPKTVRSTMGSLYRVPFYITDDLPKTIEYAKTKGVSLYAAHLKGKCSYDRPDYTGACGFMMFLNCAVLFLLLVKARMGLILILLCCASVTRHKSAHENCMAAGFSYE